MKTLNKYSINLMWVIVFSLFVLDGFSQTNRLSRQERKGIRNAQMAQNFVILDSLLKEQNFVLEADFLRDGYGNRIYVPSSLNFIAVYGSNGVLQTGYNTGRGYNGVGGVTAKGNINGWKVFKDYKKLTYSVEFSMNTNIGHYDILMTVTSENHATATISGLGRGKLSWEGHLTTKDNARIFKGQDSI